MKNFEAHTSKDRMDILNFLKLSSQEELFKNLSEEIKISDLNLPDPMSELDTTREVKKLAAANKTDYACFIGGGASKHFIPLFLMPEL